MAYKDRAALKCADLVYNGRWFTPLKEGSDAFINTTQEMGTGDVRLKRYKGNVIIAGRRLPHSLCREDYVTFGEDNVYDQQDALGFINLFGLPIEVRALITGAGQHNETK